MTAHYGLFEKKPVIVQQKILVFPMNSGKDCWVTRFVSNPGNVQSKQGSLRTCFFRYCSLQPNGNRKIEHGHGIAWFLNIAHTSEIYHPIDTSTDDVFKLYTPFVGDEIDGKLLGTPAFPATMGMKDAHLVLPRQHDACSCGFGITAGIATIVLDSLL